MTDGPHRLPVEALATALADGRLTARALLEHCLERIKRLDPVLNAMVSLDPGAPQAADDSDARRRADARLGPLDGVPVTVKDNLLMKGCPAVWGSPLYRDYHPDHDEAPVARPESEDVLERGNVITCEPGIYLEGRGGVRIEDLVVITDGEPEILSPYTKELVTVR